MTYKSSNRKSLVAIACFVATPPFFSALARADEAVPSAPEPASNVPQTESVQSKPADFVLPSARPTLPTSAMKNNRIPNRNGNFGVGPGVLPPDVRLDPIVLQKYGAAPAVIDFRFGKK
jgi:hypothetical protein